MAGDSGDREDPTVVDEDEVGRSGKARRSGAGGRGFEGGGDGLELDHGSRQVFDDFAGGHLGCGQVVGVLERLVAQPGDVEVGLVARHEFVVGEGPPTIGLYPLGAVLAGQVSVAIRIELYGGGWYFGTRRRGESMATATAPIKVDAATDELVSHAAHFMSRSKKDIVDAAVREYINAHRDEINAGIKTALGQLNGTDAAAVSLMTGLSGEELDDLGGMPK